MSKLSIQDHSRDRTGMTYVYPVVSRRAGGVSIGINLNPNNACNWRCIYCQVPDLKRGGPPPLDMASLEAELRTLLRDIYQGDYLLRHAPPEAQRVVDIAFSGNGEPTTAAEFDAAVGCVLRVRDAFDLKLPPQLRLITNGSQLGKLNVQQGIAVMGADGGEVWFKLDVVGAEAMKRINGVSLQPETVLRRLLKSGDLCATQVQTCLFALDGLPPAEPELNAYLDLLQRAAHRLAGVHLYGLARPSCQSEASRLGNLPPDWLENFGGRIRQITGLSVRVSP